MEACFPDSTTGLFPCHFNDDCSHGHSGFFDLGLAGSGVYRPGDHRSGHKFFGATSGGLATVVEKIFASYGLPNGYLLGEEGSGALIGGLTYGEGTLYTKNAGDHKVFWQGPSLGWDFGGEGSR